MGQNNDYARHDTGFGRLTEFQAQHVDQKKESIETSKSTLSSYIGSVNTVSQKNQTDQQKKIDQVGSQILKEISVQKEGKSLTPAQKQILSNVKTNVNELKKEKAVLSKEIQTNQKVLDETLRGMNKDLKELERLSKKVDSLKNAQFTSFIFGTSTKARVAKAEKKAEIAESRVQAAQIRVNTLNSRQTETSNKIKQIQTKESSLTHDLQSRIRTAKDIHQEVVGAKAEYQRLSEKYEYRKEEFANFKETSKMSDFDKKGIKEQLNKLEDHIQNLEVLEKTAGKEKIDTKIEGRTQKELRNEMQAIKREMAVITKETESLIKNAEHNKMSLGEKIGHAISNLFVSSAKSDKLNENEKKTLQVLYPGKSLEEATNLYKAKQESSAETFKDSLRKPEEREKSADVAETRSEREVQQTRPRPAPNTFVNERRFRALNSRDIAQ